MVIPNSNGRYKRAYPYKHNNNQPPQIKPLQDYIMQMSILSIGNEVIYMNDSYSNTSSQEYQELARLTSLGVEIVCRTSDLRIFYIRTKVSDAYDAGILNPALSKRILLFTLILLSPDYDRGPAFIKRIFKGTIFTSGCFLGGTRLCVDPMSLKVFPAALFNPSLLTTLTSVTTSQPDGITVMTGGNDTITVYIMGGGTIAVNSSNITTTIPLSPETNSSGANMTYIVRCDPESRASKQAPPVCGDNSACTNVSGNIFNSTLNASGNANESWCVCNPGFDRWGDSIHCKSVNLAFICQPFEFVCQGVEPSCINWNKFQDGRDDCPDGSDERCLPWQFDCKISDGSFKRCIPIDKVNDNVNDCMDGSDEKK